MLKPQCTLNQNDPNISDLSINAAAQEFRDRRKTQHQNSRCGMLDRLTDVKGMLLAYARLCTSVYIRTYRHG